MGWLRKDREPPHDGPHIELALSKPEDKDNVAAATGAAMAHILSRPDSIRQRAQHAATIASAFAAALVIAAVGQFAGGAESWRGLTTYLVVAAIVFWAVTAAMFVYTVAGVAQDRTEGYDLQNLVKPYEVYADKVRQRMRWAAAVSAAALVFTVLAVVAEIAELSTSSTRSMRLILTDTGASDTKALCGWKTPNRLMHVDARMPKDELGKRSVRIETPVGQFEAERQSRACELGTALRLPRSAIRAAIELK